MSSDPTPPADRPIPVTATVEGRPDEPQGTKPKGRSWACLACGCLLILSIPVLAILAAIAIPNIVRAREAAVSAKKKQVEREAALSAKQMKQVEREAIEAMEAAQREAEAARPGEAPKAQPGATEEESSEDAVKFDEKLDQPLLPKSEAAPAPAAPVDEDPEPPAVR